MSNDYPDEVKESCLYFPGDTHITYQYRWVNKYTSATYEALPANAKLNEYKRQRCIVLNAVTSWEDFDEH